MSLFTNRTLMITGGTGSFGNAVLNRFLKTDIGEIRIFSRDEKKQDDMRHEFQAKMPEVAEKIKFYIGDVRDLASVKNAMHGVDYIFHAAALKQVPSCEFFPIEAVKTNVLGTENVLTAAIDGHLPVHGQSGIPHQRHGHIQGDDGESDRGEISHDADDENLLHPLRQRHVLARQRHSALDRSDQKR